MGMGYLKRRGKKIWHPKFLAPSADAYSINIANSGQQ